VCVCSLIYPTCKAHTPYYIVICGLSEWTTFYTLSHKRHDFQKTTYWEENVSVDLLCKFQIFLILKRIPGDIITNVHKSSRKTRYSWQILINIQFSQHIFRKLLKILNFTKIRSEGGELFHADGQTDTKLMAAVRNFASAS